MGGTRIALAVTGLGLAVAASVVAFRDADSSGVAPRPIAQPPLVGTLPVAPDDERVDLHMPVFSRPTEVTNALHPTAALASELLLGKADGKALRVEITLLPETKLVRWNGARIEALVAQYVAFLDGALHEVALDFYAQADDGAVWYLGEDVYNFEDGHVADTEGTWLAGLHGPGAMIMPGRPRVGDVYRPENMPGHVFEEVTVKRTGVETAGPRGRVRGAIVVDELHLDGGHERKTFAPGYGEFSTGTAADVEALALAVPIDAAGGPPPPALERLGATNLPVRVRADDWSGARAELGRARRAWGVLRADTPPLLRLTIDATLDALARTVARSEATRALSGALDLAQLSLDLQLRHRPVTDVDLARFDLRAARLALAAERGDSAAVAGGLASLDWTRDRFVHVLAQRDLFALDARLDAVRGAVNDGDHESVYVAAHRLRRTLRTFARGTELLLDIDLRRRTG